MFVQLTKRDHTPVWFNAAFIVTVEPGRSGGSVVVPIGDGMDYDVLESPEKVLALLVGAPAPTVVPVPSIPEKRTFIPPPLPPEKDEESETEVRSEKTVGDAVPSSGKPVKRAKKAANARKRSTKRLEKSVEGKAPVSVNVPRLRKLAPGSLVKLVNTLSKSFHVAEPKETIQKLVEAGEIRIERDRVVWLRAGEKENSMNAQEKGAE